MLDRCIKLFISILFFISYKAIEQLLFIFNIKFPGSLVILEYHSVKKEHSEIFRKQMDTLLKVAVPVPANIERKLTSGQNYAAVTFDDGFQSVLINAVPILHEKGIPATIFITTGYLGKKPGWIKNGGENSDEILITPNQLMELQDESIAIGSHCITHTHLSKLEDTEIKKELLGSKRTLEKLLDKDINLLAYPFGDFNERVLNHSKLLGYKRVFSNVPKFPSWNINGFVSGRVFVSLEDWPVEYWLKVFGSYQWLPFAIVLKKKFIEINRNILKLVRLIWKSKALNG